MTWTANLAIVTLLLVSCKCRKYFPSALFQSLCLHTSVYSVSSSGLAVLSQTVSELELRIDKHS